MTIIIGAGIAVEGVLAACLWIRLQQGRQQSEDDRIHGALETLQAGLAAQNRELRGQVTALQEAVTVLRADTQRLAEQEGHNAVIQRIAALERRVRLDLQESRPAVTPDSGRVLLRLDRLDSRLEGSEARFAREIEELHAELRALVHKLDDPASHLRQHQVDSMVKLAELLSEITVGVAQGRATCPLPERIRQGAIAHLHRHGMFLPDEIHRSVESLLAVLLSDGESFYSGRSLDGPVPASDQDYFNNGATIPGALFREASSESRRGLRICASALGVLRQIQAYLLVPEGSPVPQIDHPALVS